ncbi:hypothetical protein [Roseibium album]|uniref:hypothetical protein n=1 Tax=Roseibium album TaxID=311410 RepID=UPI0024933BE2|nr:hypothetical protein [Roseibium album]
MRGIHFGKSALAGVAFGVGALFGGTMLSTPAPIPFSMPEYGASAPADVLGPTENEVGYVTPRGMLLSPTGTGIRRFVNPSVPVSGDGLTLATAYKTFEEAKNAARSGDLLLVVPSILPEDINIDPYPVGPDAGTAEHPIRVAPLNIGGQGGFIEFNGGDVLTGWTQCTSPAQVYGNPNWANIFTVVVSLGADPEVALKDAILQEPGANGSLVMGSVAMIAERMNNAYDMLIARHKKYWFNGAETGSSIADLTKTATTGAITLRSTFWSDANYAQGVLDGSEIWVNLANNTNFKTEIDSHDAATGDITFTNTKTEAWEGKEMAIRNVPFAISGPGQWAFRDLGGGDWQIWYQPNDPANIDQVRVSKRKIGVDLGSASHWHFYGVKVSGIGGPEPIDGRAGAVYSKQQNQFTRQNIKFENCWFTSCNGGGLTIVDVEGVEVYDTTIDRIPMGRGVVFNESKRVVADGLKILLTGITGLSTAGTQDWLISNSLIGKIRSVHGNGASAYLMAINGWLHACLFDTENAIAFATQDSGNIRLTCCVFKLGPDTASNGAIDNSDFAAGYGRSDTGFDTVETLFPDGATFGYYSNTFMPWAGASAAAVALALKIANTANAEHDAAGNIIFGLMELSYGTHTNTGIVPNVTYEATIPTPPRKNVFIGTASSGSSLLDGDNELVPDPAEVLVDPVSDPTPVLGGKADGSAGDLSSKLPLTEPWFTALPGAVDIVQRDFVGNPLDWTRAPIGAIKGPSIDNPIHPSGLTLSTDPASVDEKALVGTEIGQLSAGAGTSPIIWSLLDNAGGKFALDANTLITAGTFDYATAQEHDVEVQASNLAIGGGVASQVFSITVIENTIQELNETYTASELLIWWDARTGVVVTNNNGVLEVTNWIDRVSGLELNRRWSPPEYINGNAIRFPEAAEAGLFGDPAIDLTSLPASCNLWLRVRADAPHNAILITDGGNSSPYVFIAQDGADSDTGISTIGGTLHSNAAPTPTRGGLYDELATLEERTLFLEGCGLNTLDNFNLRGGLPSFPWNAPVTILQAAVTTNALTGTPAEVAAKIAATHEFMASQTIS